MAADDGARIIQRRLMARLRYRRRRDRKIAVDLLGRTFELRQIVISGHYMQVKWLPIRISSYDPRACMVRLLRADNGEEPREWSTDWFWHMYRKGGLRNV